MSLSLKERDRRHGELRKRMKEKGINILLVFGDTGDWGLRYGNLRYLTNSKVIFGNSALLFPIDQPPVMMMFSSLQAEWAQKLSWINNVKGTSNLIFDIVQTLKSLKPNEKRLGVSSLRPLPFAWHETLRREFPSMELIEMGPVLAEMKWLKGEEEIELVQKAAELCDKGFQSIVKGLKPGMTEFQVLSLLERPMREGGGDDFFNLIYSGVFGPGVEMSPFAPTGRKEPGRTIQPGDSLLFEITARYGGYWVQLARVATVGRQNEFLAKLQNVSRQGIEAGVSHLKPGVKLGDAIREVKKVYEAAGFEIDLPIGHICGLDLIEARIDLESGILKPGMVIIFHPPIKSGGARIFVGETYVITAEGSRRLHETPNEAFVI